MRVQYRVAYCPAKNAHITSGIRVLQAESVMAARSVFNSFALAIRLFSQWDLKKEMVDTKRFVYQRSGRPDGHEWVRSVHGVKQALHRSKKMRTPCRSSGFTLIELIVVVSLSAILLAIAVPNMSQFIQNSQIRSMSFDFHSALAVARSEALRQRGRVGICPSTNSTSSTPACAGATRDWSTGWLVFVSDDNTFNAASDLLLKVGTGAPQGLQIRSSSAVVGAFAFRPDGSLDAAAGTVRIAVCDERGGAHGIQINTSSLGASTSWKGTSDQPVNCSDPA